MRVWLAALVLASCAASPTPTGILVIPVPVSPPLPAEDHSTANTAIREYRKSEAQESQAVTKPSATPASISNIARADRIARDALTVLIQQNGHPTLAAIEQAKRARDALNAAIEAEPK